WDKTLGGNDWEAALIANEALDGGYLTAGYSRSGISGEKSEANRGGNGADCWLVKADASGSLRWDETRGCSGKGQPYGLQHAAVSGYTLVGFSNSSISGDRTEAGRGWYDFWLLKLDTARNIDWQRTWGGTGDDQVLAIFQTPDGGYITG